MTPASAMQSDPITILRAIAFGTGAVSPESLVGIGDEEARAWLKSSPEDALKLLGEPPAVVRLRKHGISVEKLNDELRASIDACASLARRERGADDHACGVLQLILGARLTVSSQDLSWLVPGRSVAQLVAAARDLAAGRLDPVNEVKPATLARLLLSPRVLAISDPWTKGVVARVIRSSLLQLSPARTLAVTAQVRIVSAMALAACGEDEFESEAILEAAGISEGLWKRMRDELQSESGATSMFAVAGGEPDFERLQALEGFARAANWLGFRFDPAHMRVRVQAERDLPQAKDPWVRLACVRAIAGDAAATDLLAGLGPARSHRARVLAGLLAARALNSPDAVAALDEEFRVHGGDGLAPRAFRALFEAAHVRGSLEAVPAKLDGWLLRAAEAYAADPRSVRELRSDDPFIACLVAGVNSGIECLKPFKREVKEELARRRREKLRSSGRLWLVELVDHCRGHAAAPERWDGGRDALTPEDCAFIGRLIAVSASDGDESKDWYAPQRLPLEASREFRMREAAFACGHHPREEFVADVEAQRRRVEAAVLDLGLPEDRVSRLRTVIARASQAVIEGPDGSAEDPRVLAAFRSADASALRSHIERARVRLPHRSVPYALVGPVSAAAILVGAACALWMAIDVAAVFGSAPSGSAPSRTPAASEPPPISLADTGLDVAIKEGITRSSKAVEKFLPEVEAMPGDDGGLTDLEARTLLDRVQRYLDGLPTGSRLFGSETDLITPVTVVAKREEGGSRFDPRATVKKWDAVDFKRYAFSIFLENRSAAGEAGAP